MAKMTLDMAMFNAYVSLVKVLHLSKAIHVDDLIAEIGHTMDFRRARHLETAEDHEMLQAVYDSLMDLAPQLVALEEARSRSKPPPE